MINHWYLIYGVTNVYPSDIYSSHVDLLRVYSFARRENIIAETWLYNDKQATMILCSEKQYKRLLKRLCGNCSGLNLTAISKIKYRKGVRIWYYNPKTKGSKPSSVYPGDPYYWNAINKKKR